jgi:putative transposase
MRSSPDVNELLLWFQKIAPDSYFDGLVKQHCPGSRKRVYWLAVVVWLMIYQRVYGDGSLALAVYALLQGGACGWQRSRPGKKRVPANRISASTGAYCQARQRLPTLVAEQVSDHIFEQLRVQVRGPCRELGRPVFVIDGSTLRLSHGPDLARAFPPGHNQHGENHWPVLLLVAFHDAYTGLAARPSWGAMYGPQAVSEQQLAEEALVRLPSDAVVLGDGNFGIFAFAHAVQRSQRPLLLRLTASRAQKILGSPVLRKGIHRHVIWKASRWDQAKHPSLPEQATTEGWLVVCRNPARRNEKLCLFTSLALSPQELLAIYKLRWNIETDLRSLKRTVGLHQIHSKAVPMAEKELLLAVAAYNLIRAIMFLAAQRYGLAPRQLSFAGVQAAVMAALPGLDRAASNAEYDQRMELLLEYAARARLPHRKRKRFYPRQVWGRGASFPTRQSSTAKRPTS